MAEVQLLGVRHHGPGSARSVLRALEQLQPTAVLVELPADCEPLLAWVGRGGLTPPVALLGHVVDQPQQAAFLPFASFSPEWQAIRWASEHGAVVRAIDLPLLHSLVQREEGELIDRHEAQLDPLVVLAAAAGEPDAERWWDDVIEHRGDGAPAFEAVGQAMAALRDGVAVPLDEERREAHMRVVLRRALAEGHERVAVVCGAWHVPALREPLPPASVDARTLRGLPKVKVAISWVPWTHRRLAITSGYGAGVRSPGWYAHVFEHPGPQGVAQWFVRTARLLREHGLSASPDHLIAATRTADTLAALRDRPRAGLAEVLDAAHVVMAGDTGLALVERELVVGSAIGEVPPEAPTVPLARDLAVQQRRGRLKPEADPKVVELDLRTPRGRERSVLLHRLAALELPWAWLTEGRGSSGSFRETWELRWEPEAAVRLVELSALGTTVQAAAARRLLERATPPAALADLMRVLEQALLGDLDEVVQPVVALVAEQAAHDPDLSQIIDTLGPLARALRYGDVRGTPAEALRAVFDGVVVRVLAGMVVACRSLAPEYAAAMVERLTDTQAALALVDHPARAGEWPAVLALLAERSDVHGLVQGRAARLLHDSGVWNSNRIEARVGRALSGGSTPASSAAFVEGFLAGSGAVLVHDRDLLGLLDGWLTGLGADEFIAAAPLLRRTFGSFEPAERRQLGLLLAHGESSASAVFGAGVDAARAAAALATVGLLLGGPSLGGER